MTKKEVTQLSYEIVGVAIKIHKALGPGLLESIYEKCMIHELRKQGYKVETQLPVKIKYEDLEIKSNGRETLTLLIKNSSSLSEDCSR